METDNKCAICGGKADGVALGQTGFRVPICAKCYDDLFWEAFLPTDSESKMAHCVNSESEILENHEENS